ncbi:hypothetical protein [Oryza sativa Japonica Group]|uniref:Uncharacterized protein n=1 Tax=Oryza sativa subsp. japonica TaxID=39947 RepID=Q5N8Y5_ORYSJ|nr:hypothetical protein [Oryza sativa Japonica Group]
MKHEQQPRISAAETGRSARAGTIAARSDATDSKIGPRADDRPRPPTPPPPPTWRQPSPRTRRPPRDPPDRGRTTTGRRRGEEVQACKASYLGERDRAACGGGGEAEEEEGKDGREREREARSHGDGVGRRGARCPQPGLGSLDSRVTMRLGFPGGVMDNVGLLGGPAVYSSVFGCFHRGACAA